MSRNVCDYFWEEVTRCGGAPDLIPPIITTPRFFLFSVTHFAKLPSISAPSQSSSSSTTAAATAAGGSGAADAASASASAAIGGRGRIYFVAVCGADVNALVPVEFLHRMEDVLEEYFGPGFGEAELTEEFTKVYQLLEEMADNGCPVQTEPAILRQMVAAPNAFGKLGQAMGASEVNSELPLSTLTSIPWRRAGVRYTSNEFFLDLVEDVDAIIDAGGAVVSCQVVGAIHANCRLGGMPDLSLTFANPQLLDDVSLHPCVRYYRWEQNRLISFIPPDGRFKLMTYRVKGGVVPPIDVRSTIRFTDAGSGKVDIAVAPKHFPGKLFADEIVLTIPFPKAVSSVTLVASQGYFSFDQKSKVATWTIGRWMPTFRQPTLTGSVTLQANAPRPESAPVISVSFKVLMFTASGIRVDSLNVVEKYKPYKGVRSVTRGGQYFIRS